MEESGSPRKSETAAAANLWRPAMYTAYTVMRASIAVAASVMKATVAIIIAGGAISFSPVMVAVLLAYFLAHLLMDELTESLTRPVAVIKQLPAVKAQSKTGTVLAVARAGISTVFVTAGAGSFTGICSGFTMMQAIIWFVFALAYAGTLTVLAVG